MKSFKIGKRTIGQGHPCFIVAEMSGNHNQDINRAYEIIESAAQCGVDAVKLQTYTPDTLTINCDNEYFRIGKSNSWSGLTLYELYRNSYTPWEWQSKLKKFGEKHGLVVFSTPFDETAIDFLENMHVLLYKVASFEINDIELLIKIAKTHKPIIISVGLASQSDIVQAIRILEYNGAESVAVLHCVSSYPALPEQMNLAHIVDLRNRFNVVTGLSDHSLGINASKFAVGEMKASIIEKHFTLNRADGGPDAAFSLEPHELKNLVQAIRLIEEKGFHPTEKELSKLEVMRGVTNYLPDSRESENIIFKRSLFVVKDMKTNEQITRENIRCIRPGFGMHPAKLKEILGRRVNRDLYRGTPFKSEYIKEL